MGYADGKELDTPRADDLEEIWKKFKPGIRVMRATIVNDTDKPIRYIKEFFVSLRMYIVPPPEIQPHSSVTFKPGGTGSILVRMKGRTVNNFSLGFCSPISGSYKVGVAASDEVEAGYDNATWDGGSAETEDFKVVAKVDPEKAECSYTFTTV